MIWNRKIKLKLTVRAHCIFDVRSFNVKTAVDEKISATNIYLSWAQAVRGDAATYYYFLPTWKKSLKLCFQTVTFTPTPTWVYLKTRTWPVTYRLRAKLSSMFRRYVKTYALPIPQSTASAPYTIWRHRYAICRNSRFPCTHLATFFRCLDGQCCRGKCIWVKQYTCVEWKQWKLSCSCSFGF